MKLNFPAQGHVTLSTDETGRSRFVMAPLAAVAFPLRGEQPFAIGRNYTLIDDFGTKLIYNLEWAEFTAEDFPRGSGSLVGAEYAEQTIPVSEHDAKLSTAIDQAFEVGRSVGRQEEAEALQEDTHEGFTYFTKPVGIWIRFADNTSMWHSEIGAVSEVDGELTLLTTEDRALVIHPSWRSFEIITPEEEPAVVAVDEDDDDTDLIAPTPENMAGVFGAMDKGEYSTCLCDTCETVRYAEGGSAEAPAAVVGERAPETILPSLTVNVSPDTVKALGGEDAFAKIVRDATNKVFGQMRSGEYKPLPPGRLFRYGPVGNRIDD